MDYHLERTLRLKTETPYQTLYNWAVNEVDEQGDEIGRDQIPWVWDHYFTATSLELSDTLQVKKEQPEGQAEKTEITQRQIIRIELKPGDPRDGGDDWNATDFRMFGTDRKITKFQLQILAKADPAEPESIRAWGTPSYTHESDFTPETNPDCIVFYLMVTPETFTRYAAKITMAAADEIVFRVGTVSGFYSEWSPSISTRHVKVLTRGREHKVELPAGVEFELPRLGDVGEGEIYINRKLAFAMPPRADDDEGTGTVLVEPQARPAGAAVPDLQVAKLLKSIKTAAWVIAAAAVITAIKMVF